MSRRQGDHFRPIPQSDQRIIALEQRLKTLQRAWRRPAPTYKKELDLNTRAHLKRGEFLPLWTKQNGRCAYCCIDLHESRYHIDHIIPRSKGGPNAMSNYAIACMYCNITKKASSVMDFALHLLSGNRHRR